MLTFGSVLLTLLGWGGAACSVLAYGLVTQKRIQPDSMLYQGLNLGGAATLCISASVSAAWPSAVVNIVWVGIGLQAVLTAQRHVIRARLARRARSLRTLRGPVPVERATPPQAPLILR